MIKRRSQKELLEGRIRELKRKIVHERNVITRNIYKDHINYLCSRVARLEQ